MPNALIAVSAFNLLVATAIFGWAGYNFVEDERLRKDGVLLAAGVAMLAFGASKAALAVCLWLPKPWAWRTAIASEAVVVLSCLVGIAVGLEAWNDGGLDILLTIFIGIPAAILLALTVGEIIYFKMPHIKQWFGVHTPGNRS